MGGILQSSCWRCLNIPAKIASMEGRPNLIRLRSEGSVS
jgi:hypothetical protein